MGARAYRHDGAAYDIGIIWCLGGFAVNNTSDPVAWVGPAGLSTTTLPSGITSITYAATGIYTLTFTENFYTCLSPQVHLSLATAADSSAQFNGFSNLGTAGATLTCTITTITAGSAAAITAGTNKIVYFSFPFKNSSAL